MIDRAENPVDKAQLLLITYLIYQMGPLAAAAAVMAGAPMKAAYANPQFHDGSFSNGGRESVRGVGRWPIFICGGTRDSKLTPVGGTKLGAPGGTGRRTR